jgi:predicted  nucleic acid-binding Zn-ribbon protein
MNSIETFERPLRDETDMVEKEIESHKQQLEALNKRLEGLKRAAELFESEQGAISELLQAGSANGGVIDALASR